MIRFLLLLILVSCLAEPAEAKLTLGLVSDGEALATEVKARKIAYRLARALGETVRIERFSNEEGLYDWLAIYQMVDLAILSRPFYDRQPAGETRYLAGIEAISPPRTDEIVAARPGLDASRLQPIAQALFGRTSPGGESEVPQILGGIRFVPPENLQTETPAQGEQKPEEGTAPAAGAAGRQSEGSLKEGGAPDRKGEARQQSYSLTQLAGGIYAAIARPEGNAVSNAFFFLGKEGVVASGAHMSEKGTADFLAAIAQVTELPLRTFILAHHHRGNPTIDTHFPPGIEVIMSGETRETLAADAPKLPFAVVSYQDELRLTLGGREVLLTNMGKGHTAGDTLLYLPADSVLFTSDLLHVDSVGRLEDGHMLDWVVALEYLEGLGAQKVVPGFGPVSPPEKITAFKSYLKNFLSRVLSHIEEDDSLEKTVSRFDFPEYRQYRGYDQHLSANVRRAYLDLTENVLKE